MTDTECIHGLGPVSACVLCNGRAAAEHKMDNEVDYVFTAKFDGPTGCGHAAEVGDRLARLKSGRIVCEDCAE